MKHEPGRAGRHHGRGQGSGHGGHGGRDGLAQHGRRLFAPGDFRLLLLSLLQGRAAHGYELMRLVADMFGGTYTPSPGMIYPTLTWLEEQGLIRRQIDSAHDAAAEAASDGRKRFEICTPGREHLRAQQAELEGLLARLRLDAQSLHARQPPDSIREALHTLRHALHVSNLEWSATRTARVRAAIEALIAAVSAR